MKQILSELVGKEVEIWTLDSPDQWKGTLKEVTDSLALIESAGIKTYIVIEKISAFRLSEDAQKRQR